MFNLQDAYTNITLDNIFSKVSEYELWKYYCPNFIEINKPFLSDLYNDKNPDCRIFYATNNHLLYKDFGDGGKTYGIIEYIQNKYFCTFTECLNIINNDFKISNSPKLVNKESRVLLVNDEFIIKPKTRIDIITQSFNIVDFNYWDQYKIPLDLLQEYNVFACKYVYLIKGDKVTTFSYSKTNPIYAYRFVNNGEYSYKIYFPYADKKYKWLFNGGSAKDIEGYDQLPLSGDKVILTKSLKDCMCYNLLGYPAISLQGETNKLEYDFVDKLLKRFDEIIINYDNDEEGIRGSKRLEQQYSFKSFFTDKEKDLSDYIKKYGLNKAKQMINKQLKQL
jgi:Crassvirales DNA primase